MIARPTLQAIQIAKRQLRLDDDDYRAMLLREGGVDSSTKLDAAGARRVMAWFDNHGFVSDKKRGTAADRRPIVAKARALWISLHQLDEVANRHDAALDAFAKGIVGKETLRFATNAEAAKVVEALKSWAERVGWNGGTRPRLSLVQLQYARLFQAGHVAHADPAGLPERTDTELSEIADRMGAAIRRLRLGDRHKPLTSSGA